LKHQIKNKYYKAPLNVGHKNKNTLRAQKRMVFLQKQMDANSVKKKG
jgi:hypothetical protein